MAAKPVAASSTIHAQSAVEAAERVSRVSLAE